MLFLNSFAMILYLASFGDRLGVFFFFQRMFTVRNIFRSPVIIWGDLRVLGLTTRVHRRLPTRLKPIPPSASACKWVKGKGMRVNRTLSVQSRTTNEKRWQRKMLIEKVTGYSSPALRMQRSSPARTFFLKEDNSHLQRGKMREKDWENKNMPGGWIQGTNSI